MKKDKSSLLGFIIGFGLVFGMVAGVAFADGGRSLEGQWAVTIQQNLATTNDVWVITRSGNGYVIESKIEGRMPIIQLRDNGDGFDLELQPTAWERSTLNVIRKTCRLVWQDDRTIQGQRVSTWRLQGVMDGELNEAITMHKLLSDQDRRQSVLGSGAPVQLRLDPSGLRAYRGRLPQLRENLRSSLEKENVALKQRADLLGRQGDQQSALGDSARGDMLKMANYGAAQGYFRNAALLSERISRNLNVLQLLKNPTPVGDTPQQLLNNFDGIWSFENEANYALAKWQILVSGGKLKIFTAPQRSQTDQVTDYMTSGTPADSFEALNIANVSLSADGALSFTITQNNEAWNVSCYLLQQNLVYGSVAAGNSRSNLRLIKIGRNSPAD